MYIIAAAQISHSNMFVECNILYFLKSHGIIIFINLNFLYNSGLRNIETEKSVRVRKESEGKRALVAFL